MSSAQVASVAAAAATAALPYARTSHACFFSGAGTTFCFQCSTSACRRTRERGGALPRATQDAARALVARFHHLELPEPLHRALVAHVADHRVRIRRPDARVHNVEPEMLLRILVFVAPEHEEVLGGRRPALVRRSMLRSRIGWSLGRHDRDGIHDHFCWRNVSCSTWHGGKGGSSTQAERSALVEAVGDSSSSAIRLWRARARRRHRTACMAERFSFLGICSVSHIQEISPP